MEGEMKSCWNCGEIYQPGNESGLNVEVDDTKQKCRVWCDCGVAGPWAEDTEMAIDYWNACPISSG